MSKPLEEMSREELIEENKRLNQKVSTERNMRTCTNCGGRVPARGCCQWCHTWRDEMED